MSEPFTGSEAIRHGMSRGTLRWKDHPAVIVARAREALTRRLA